MSRVTKATDEYKRLRKEVSRLASIANKRLDRLETNNLTMLPAYESWQQMGGVRFSVKGKTKEQVQSEYWRLKSFLDNKTSTVRDANRFLREMAENTGIQYNGLNDLKTKSRKFFELAEKIKTYNQLINQTAQALDYQKIWQQINTAVQQDYINLADAVSSDEQLEQFLEYMDKVQPVENGKQGYTINQQIYDWIDE